jgi:hypothetical protein
MTTTELRAGLPPLPPRMERLPLDAKGYPVPYFVAWVDGVPDHRIVDAEKLRAARRDKACWLCGQPLGRYGAFVIGPMCCINRVSSEPPSHVDCADFAARACPFMTKPKAVRREAALPDGVKEPAGIMARRNPGVTLLWVSERWRSFAAPGGELVDIGEATETRWYAEGRRATRAEVEASIASGCPTLEALAAQEGPHALAELARRRKHAERYLPADEMSL